MSACGPQSGEVKLYTTGTLDQVINWNYSTSPVVFISGQISKSYSKYRLVGHVKGELEIIEIEKLKIESTCYLNDLADDEELTAAAFNASGLNFALGTSKGRVYFGTIHKGRLPVAQIKVAPLFGLAKDEDHAVTSIQISVFNPDGCLLVAFDNGQIRVWQSVRNVNN